MTELAGVMVGNYFLLECLGREGMVETYLARPTNQGGYDVTLRLFHPPFPDPTSFQEHFPVEVRKLWRCQHPSIQPLVEFGEGDGLLYTATRPDSSMTLAQLLERQDTRRYPLSFLTEIMTHLCEALHYAHSHGIVHGNLQPSSILLGQDGRIRLTNFSLKQTYHAGDPAVAQIDEGNAAYTAPEQVVGMLAPASDIYALGILLYRLLGGVLPYDGKSAGEIALLHANEPIPSLRQLRPDLPEAIEMVLRITLAKDPAARFADPRSFAEALLKALLKNQPPIIAIRPSRHIPVRSRHTPLVKSRAFSLLTLLLVFASLGSALYLFSFPTLPMLPLRLITQKGGLPGAIPISLPRIGPFAYPTPTSGTARAFLQPGQSQQERPTPGPQHHQPTPGPRPDPTQQPGVTPVATATVPIIQQSPITLPYTPTVTPEPTPTPLACVPGSLKIDGSFYLAPLLQQIGSDYQVFCPGLNLTLGNQGSSAGLAAMESGQVDLADSDLSAPTSQNLTDYPVAALLYSVIVSPDVSIRGLSSQQLKAIYQGKVTNWSQVGGPNEAIHVLVHPAGDPLKAIFQTFVLNGATEQVQGANIAATPEQTVQQVAQTPGAITYVPLDVTSNAGVRVLAINRVLPTVQNLLRGFYPFWSVEHLYAQGSATAQGQSYIQFLQATPENNRLAQSGAVPYNFIPPPILATHLPGPYLVTTD